MKTSLKMLVFFTFVTGVIYPVVITGVSQVLFSYKANGSLLQNEKGPVGSALIAQEFKESRYFWPRPSAINYNAASSGATNLGPTSKKLKEDIQGRMNHFTSSDLLTSSSSGLDPHLTPEAVNEQMERVVQARGFSEEQKKDLQMLITNLTESRTAGILGNPRINVLVLNQKMDELK